MGIERFFNSLKKDFNIIDSFNPNSKKLIDTNYLFIDFNSIIHFISQRVNYLVNNALMLSLMEYNGCSDQSYLDKIDLLNLDEKIDIKLDSENIIIQSFKNYFTSERLDDIIIKNVGIFLKHFFNKFNKNKIKFIYLAVDGVPSKAKMVEQKKRRFIGEFEKNIKLEIIEKYKDQLDINKTDNCSIPYNKYNYLQNKIIWSRGNISPGTFFMVKLGRFLNNKSFKNEVNKILPLVRHNNFILSNFTDKDEGEKKIMDYINDTDNAVSGKICIFSPDADIILLSMILKNKNIEKTVLRNDQQRSTKIINLTDSYYDLIDIDTLENELFNYMKNKDLNKIKVINDIVFIFTFFGDDFLHKIESFNVRNDIELILDIYKDLLEQNDYTNCYLLNNDDIITINYNNFMKILEMFSKMENKLIQRNYFEKKYKNYSYLLNKINNDLKNKKYEYSTVDHNNVLEFIKKNNINNVIKEFEIDLIELINKFITIEVNPRLKKTLSHLQNISITLNNINLVPINHFIEFLKRVNNTQNINKDIYTLFNTRCFRNFLKLFEFNNELINYELLNNELLNSNNFNSEIIKKKYNIKNIKDINSNKKIELLILYYYINNSLPIIKYNIPSLRPLKLELFPFNINNSRFSKDIETMNEYDKNILKFDNMLDEYNKKLNKAYDTPLGNPKYSFEEGKQKFYNDFFQDIDLSNIIRMYIDGLQWVVDYYFNGITYQKWFFMYHKSPLLQDIFIYLKNTNDDDIFNNSKKALQKCCQISVTEELTPLEQLLYITPFDKNASQIKFLDGYSEEIIIKCIDLLSKFKSDDKNLF